MNKKDIKEKWLKQYQEEISLHRDQREKERIKRLQEEQEYLKKIKRELQEEKSKKYELKKKIENDFINDYESKINSKRRLMEKKSNTDNASLDLKSEERIQDLKNYINKLTEKVDKNMNDYVEYQKNMKIFSDTTIESTNEMKTNVNNKVNNSSDNSATEKYNLNITNNNQQLQEKPINYSLTPSNRLDLISNRNYLQYREVKLEYIN